MNKNKKVIKKQELSTKKFLKLDLNSVQSSFKDRMKEAVYELAIGIMEDEVEMLCGSRFDREGEFYRGGSDKSRIIVNNGKMEIFKPRVRDAKNKAVELETFKKLKNQDLLDENISNKMIQGISTRNYEGLFDEISNLTSISKSNISRAFKRQSSKILSEFNEADLSGYSFVAIAIDGFEINGKMLIVCLGITDDMKKIPIGLKEGCSENYDTVKDLLAELIERKFTKHCDRLLCLLDGSKALKKAVLSVFGKDTLVQRCWLHKSRNIKSYLPKTYHAKAHRWLKKIMGLNNYVDAKKEYKSFHTWLSSISTEAANSLDEAGEDLLTLHQLQVTGELKKSLSSTNMIESCISNIRYKSNRVKNWKHKDQSLRWTAIILDKIKSKFKALRGSTSQAQILIMNLNYKKTVDAIAA